MSSIQTPSSKAAQGAVVHWAGDAAEHNAIVLELLQSHGVERIIQLRGEPPRHIVLPAIHLKKEDVGETFHKHRGTEKSAADPQYLTEAARGQSSRARSGIDCLSA